MSCFPELFLLQVSLATFAVYVLLGNELTAGKAFVAISLFNILRFPLTVLPRVVMNFIQVCRARQRTLWQFTDGGQISIGWSYLCYVARLCNRPFYSFVPVSFESLAGGDLALMQSSLLFACKCVLVSIRTAWFPLQKQWGLYRNKVTPSCVAIQRPGHWADTSKMDHSRGWRTWPLKLRVCWSWTISLWQICFCRARN